MSMKSQNGIKCKECKRPWPGCGLNYHIECGGVPVSQCCQHICQSDSWNCSGYLDRKRLATLPESYTFYESLFDNEGDGYVKEYMPAKENNQTKTQPFL